MANAQTTSRFAGEAFSLTKWYLDCTSGDGRTAIGYFARLRWGAVSLTWQALNLWEHGALIAERSTLAPGATPRRDENGITWSARRLGCEFVVEPIGDPVHLRLFERADGSLDWTCEAPVANVTVRMAERSWTTGTGYVECIRMTIPPWRLPIRQLRWGRWIDDGTAHAVVWIEWRGSEPRTWILVDGVLAADADVEDASVAAGPTVLTLERECTLSARSLAEIVGRIAPLRAIVPGSLMSLRQVKWRSRGALRRSGCPGSSGTAIHELVVFHDGADTFPRS